MTPSGQQTSGIWIGFAVAVTGIALAWVNITNAQNLQPQWSQDLAFFHQWVHSAANGGPWASPLILEPQGFFEQVHTHLLLPAVVGAYWMVPRQETLLLIHSFGVALTVWPTWRLAERAGGRVHGVLIALALIGFGPFLAVGVADFRPLVFVIPAITGIWASAYGGSMRGCVVWAMVALLARQDSSYLLISTGAVLCLLPWGKSRRIIGGAVLGIGLVGFASFAFLKPEMFFHINLGGQASFPTGSELWDNRKSFVAAFALSLWWLGIRRPAPLIACLPVFWGMLTTAREWHLLTGPGAHHHAFWLPFVIASVAVGTAGFFRYLSAVGLIVMGIVSFPYPVATEARPELSALLSRVNPNARVAADYDTIHRLAGRATLWNVDQFYVEERPRHWADSWPLTVDAVDVIVAPPDHPVLNRIDGWLQTASTSTHVMVSRP